MNFYSRTCRRVEDGNHARVGPTVSVSATGLLCVDPCRCKKKNQGSGEETTRGRQQKKNKQGKKSKTSSPLFFFFHPTSRCNKPWNSWMLGRECTCVCESARAWIFRFERFHGTRFPSVRSSSDPMEKEGFVSIEKETCFPIETKQIERVLIGKRPWQFLLLLVFPSGPTGSEEVSIQTHPDSIRNPNLPQEKHGCETRDESFPLVRRSGL